MAFSTFIPEVWSARLLAHLDKIHVFAALCNRDYEGEIKQYGDTVHINQIVDITVRQYTGADIEGPEDLDGEETVLKIDQSDYFNFRIKDIDNAQSQPKLMDAAMERAAYGMNDTVDKYIESLMVAAATAANQIVDGSGLDATTAYEALVDLGTKLTEANVPMIGRWAIVTPAFHGMLQKDQRFVGNGTDYNSAILQNGIVGAAAGFAIHVSNNCTVPAVAGTNIAASFAEQLTEVKAYSPESNFADAMKGLHVYGAKVTQPSALVIISGSGSTDSGSTETDG